jgi:sulfide:quinone oxidoreductase
MTRKFDVVVLGGGNGGLSVVSRLRRARPSLKVALIEPSDKHYYQPAWTLVGGGVYNNADTERDEAQYIPEGVEWIRQKAVSFEMSESRIFLGDGTDVFGDWIILAPGIQLNFGLIQGLEGNLGHNGIVSIYGFGNAPKVWEAISSYRGGSAVFTNPNTPIKCGGAPQKIMYLASDHWRKNGQQAQTAFWSGGGVLFGVEKYRKTLEKVVERYGIEVLLKNNLVAVDAQAKVATFDRTDADGQVTRVQTPFELLHVVPPQSAPDFIRQSDLVNAAGWIDVDKHTLRHQKYPNVFALGDAAGTPNAKTGAAIRKQAPVVVENLLAAMDGRDLSASYQGYGSCPLITGYGSLVLAEFDYENKPVETFPFDQSQERYSMWLLKRYALPFLYWNGILQGRM